MFRSLVSWIKAHSLLTYFALTLLLIWGTCIPLVLSLPVRDSRYITTGGRLLMLIGLWSPALSAILTTAITRGKPGLKDLGRKLLFWRVPARWYLVFLLGLPAIMVLSALLHAQVSGHPLLVDWSRWQLILTLPLGMVINGWYVCEELGWRGFALPHLQKRWNAFLSSLILALVWDLWHLPYFMGVKGLSAGVPFSYYLAFIIATSIIMTWIFNNTKGSVLVAVLYHTWTNFCISARGILLPQENQAELLLATDWLMAAAAILVVIVCGYQSFTRSRPSSVPFEMQTNHA